ncbi:MAG: type II toxin-antitoxin system RelE/ParE family toxin [Nitrospirae bacterium]|nr:type II toxin-antitoxin system RelE/ParE family toxin [Nitrospirota bacterium]
MFEVRLSDEALKFCRKVSSKTPRKLDRCFASPQVDPFAGAHVRKLRGELTGSYRYGVGSMRVVYSIDGERNCVLVETIGPRGDIY